MSPDQPLRPLCQAAEMIEWSAPVDPGATAISQIRAKLEECSRVHAQAP